MLSVVQRAFPVVIDKANFAPIDSQLYRLAEVESRAYSILERLLCAFNSEDALPDATGVEDGK